MSETAENRNTRPLCLISRTQSTVLKGIAILLVLLGHTGFITWGGAGGVAIFLIVSGYGIHSSCEQNGLKKYWRKRIRKVWIPYVIVSIFVLIGNQITDTQVILYTLIGIDFDLIADKSMWYISFIMLWYLAYYLLRVAFGRIGNYWIRNLCMVAGLFGCIFGFSELLKLNVWPEPRGTHCYLFAFPLGVGLCMLGKIRVPGRIHALVWFLILFAGATYLFAVYQQMYDAWMALAMSMIPIAAVMLVDIHPKILPVFLWLGKYSYSLYLFEWIFIGKSEQWFSVFNNPDFSYPAMFLITGLFAVVYQNALDRILDGKGRRAGTGEPDGGTHEPGMKD